MKLYNTSEFFDNSVSDGVFAQTGFADSAIPHSISFASTKMYVGRINKNFNVSCVITTEELANEFRPNLGVVIHPSPETSFYMLHNLLISKHGMGPRLNVGIDQSAQIHPTAYVEDAVSIGKHVVVGPGAVVLAGSVLERNVFIGANAVVGAEGHFYKRLDGRLFRVLHGGGVYMAAGSQLLAGAVISKAVDAGFTWIGVESVVSVNAHVAHGCRIGARCTLAGNSQVAGYASLGDDVWVGPSATIGSRLKVGKGSRVEIGSVVINGIDDGSRVSGNFAEKHSPRLMKFLRNDTGKL